MLAGFALISTASAQEPDFYRGKEVRWILSAGTGGGYTAELLARAIGPTGKVYGQSRPRPATPPPAPTNTEGNSNPTVAAAPPAATTA